jgi:hypothetical protein
MQSIGPEGLSAICLCRRPLPQEVHRRHIPGIEQQVHSTHVLGLDIGEIVARVAERESKIASFALRVAVSRIPSFPSDNTTTT